MIFSKAFIRFQWTTLIFIYLVVFAGSFVRISGSGMGCPDWPKCFGQWVPPTNINQLPSDYKDTYSQIRHKKITKFSKFLRKIGLEETAQKIEADPTILVENTFNSTKTWIEYANRLCGFIAGNLMLFGFFWILIKYRKRKLILLTLINLILMGIEGWFGSIVVASNLVPWTITVHMLLALIIIGIQLYTLRIIDPKQQAQIHFKSLMKVLVYIVFFITFYQMFLGTQVREFIDVLTKNGVEKHLMNDSFDFTFFIHRSFSWLVLALMTFMLWKNEKEQKYQIFRSAYIVLALELISGVILYYFDLPGLIQTSHLIFATILFGILCMMVFRLYAFKKI